MGQLMLPLCLQPSKLAKAKDPPYPEGLLLPLLPRLDQPWSLKAAHIPALQPGKCSTSQGFIPLLKSCLWWWPPYFKPCLPTTETLLSLALIFSIWFILLTSHPLASMCYCSVYKLLLSTRTHENRELCAGPIRAYYTDGLHYSYLVNK